MKLANNKAEHSKIKALDKYIKQKKIKLSN
jgi:hypothetical protein